MPAHPELVLSSRNAKKIREIRELVEPLGIGLIGIDQFPQAEEVVEDGDTFAANAAKKAAQPAIALGRWVLAEDSGLCVEALGGQPGIHSARYAGEHGRDDENNAKLLRELADVPIERRRAYYVCYAVVCDPSGQVRCEAEGRCYGRILTEHHGQQGFGYDPLFQLPEYHQTFGQLAPAVKRHLSHRAKAFEQLLPKLAALFPPAR